MPRQFNTNVSGDPFDGETIEAVWKKSEEEAGFTTFRKDSCGATVQRYDYGKTTNYGWEIDHVKPVAKGGTDDLSNLQPLHWENNRHKGDNWPKWDCRRRW